MKYILLYLLAAFSLTAEVKPEFVAFKVNTIKISADDVRGEKIGKLKAGQIVSVKYVEGKWTAYEDWEMESPDHAEIAQHKIVLKRKGKKGEPDYVVVKTNIENTADTAVQITIEDEGEYFIGIADKVKDGNEGVVEYEIGISKEKE